MGNKFRIRKVERPVYSEVYPHIDKQYHVESLRKFLFWTYWKIVKTKHEDYWKPVIFDRLSDAQDFLRGLKIVEKWKKEHK